MSDLKHMDAFAASLRSASVRCPHGFSLHLGPRDARYLAALIEAGAGTEAYRRTLCEEAEAMHDQWSDAVLKARATLDQALEMKATLLRMLLYPPAIWWGGQALIALATWGWADFAGWVIGGW